MRPFISIVGNSETGKHNLTLQSMKPFLADLNLNELLFAHIIPDSAKCLTFTKLI